MRALLLSAIILAAFGLSGCNVQYFGTAPATPGKVYVVGQNGGQATVWLCPDKTATEECEKVKVTTD